jgi:hypothetical protein
MKRILSVLFGAPVRGSRLDSLSPQEPRLGRRPDRRLPRSLGRKLASATLLGVAVALTACGGGGGGGSSGTPGSGVTGGFDYPPGFEISPAGFIIDPNQGGESNDFQLLEMFWGRLVDVYDFDAANDLATLQHRSFVIGEEVFSDGVDYELATNGVTEVTSLRILHKAGTSEYKSAFDRIADNVGPIAPNGYTSSGQPFSFVPRNGVLVLRFNDFVDHTTISSNTVQVRTGLPPVQPFEARLLPDPNHGGLVSVSGGKEFRTTRIIIDPTVSELEAENSPVAIPVNALGFPPSVTTSAPNVAVVIPTQLSFSTGQFALLKGGSAEALKSSSSAPVDLGSPSVDILRTMRSGGTGSVAVDQNNGFLLDLIPPRIIGTQPLTVTSILPASGFGDDAYLISVAFQSSVCKVQPEVGDVVQMPGIFAEVIQAGTPPDSNGIVNGLLVRLLTGDASSFVNGQATFLSTYDPAKDLSRCFVRFSPIPGKFPVTDVDPNSVATVRFSEPMDPGSVKPFDTFMFTRNQTNFTPSDIFVGDVLPSSDLREFRFAPIFPFSHSNTSSEKYYCSLIGGASGVNDLAGNKLATSGFIPPVEFTLNPAALDERNGGIVLRFSSANEDGDPANKPEVRSGQVLFDFQKGVIKPRPVTRFSAIADRTTPIVSNMITIGGILTPLSRYGSRLMHLYRYADVGFTISDETGYNIDIERMAWVPLNGLIVSDFFESYEMTLTHSLYLPDEKVDTNLLPSYPNSGFNDDGFDLNVLVDPKNERKIVSPKQDGYLLDPTQVFVSQTNTLMYPWPMNVGNDPELYKYYTWRDTTIQALGAPGGQGTNYGVLETVGLIPVGTAGQFSLASVTPTIGLPLLVEHKCYPTEALSLTLLDTSIAINSSSVPNFRVFSTGGLDASQNPIVKNPDTETVPDGGLCGNPVVCTLGSPTPGDDNLYYLGQLDIVYRVTRTVTIWFDTFAPSPNYAQPVLEPRPDDQPLGTSVVIAFRGAAEFAPGKKIVDAQLLDAYGDEKAPTPPNSTLQYGNPADKNPSLNPKGFYKWFDTIDEIDGKRMFQMRFSFFSNTKTNATPELSAVGVPYLK